MQLQLAGVGKWNLSNFYNAAANDFIITDVTNTLNRLTIKNTGQTFIGTDVTSSGAFVVNNATSDNHIVCIGANAPSIRLRNTGTSPTLNVGLGISTATNNFIQGSASGNYCIFNSSTTASPILFGIYDAGTLNTQEAARISASRNLLVGTVIDGGYKLQVSGTSLLNGNVGIGPSSGVLKLDVQGNAADTTTVSSVTVEQVTIFRPSNGVGGIRTGFNTTTGDAYLWSAQSGASLNFGVRNAPNNTAYLSIASTGVSTFSSSIAIGNTVTASVLNTVTNKVSIIIGGVQYYLLASTSAI